jgi:hypothetical protein
MKKWEIAKNLLAIGDKTTVEQRFKKRYERTTARVVGLKIVDFISTLVLACFIAYGIGTFIWCFAHQHAGWGVIGIVVVVAVCWFGMKGLLKLTKLVDINRQETHVLWTKLERRKFNIPDSNYYTITRSMKRYKK